MPVQPDRDISEVLTPQRIASAQAALADPDRHHRIEHTRLEQDERRVIGAALEQAPHPLAGFARTVLDDWDHLAVDDQVGMLLLFAQIAEPVSQRRRTAGLELGR